MTHVKVRAKFRTGYTSPDGNADLVAECPKCGAGRQQRCRRWIGGRVRGEDIGGGYWRTLKNIHDERREVTHV